MSEKQPIFVHPIKNLNDHPGPLGITLRAYIATAALQGMLAAQAHPTRGDNVDEHELAQACVLAADALLLELSK